MICPACDADRDPAARVGDVAVCASCGECVIVEEPPRKAVFVDLSRLPDGDVQHLRRARARIVRAPRQPSGGPNLQALRDLQDGQK